MMTHTRSPTRLIVALLGLAAFMAFAGGCEKEVAHTKETQIKDDGTVKTKEKTVTEDADGDRTVTEEKTTQTPGG